MLISIIEIIANLLVFYAHYKQSAVYYIPYFVISVRTFVNIIFQVIIPGNYIIRWNYHGDCPYWMYNNYATMVDKQSCARKTTTRRGSYTKFVSILGNRL